MRAVVTAVLRDDLAELDEFGGVREHAGRVGETAAHPGRTLRESLGEQPLHLVDLGRGRGTVRSTDDHHPQGALRDQVRRVAGDALIEPVEISGHVGPGEVEVVRLPVPAGDLAPYGGPGGVVDRRERQPVLAEHLQRDALADLGRVVRIRQDLQVGVRMHVDEPRREHQAFGVDHPLS